MVFFFILVFPLFAQQKELRVIATTPLGVLNSIDQGQTISVTFSEPMVALQEVPKDESSGPMIIEPKVNGKYRWMGSLTLTFIPDQLLLYSNSYKVTIPADTKSQSGLKLKQSVQWTFETPRPKVIWSFPGKDDSHVDTNTAILLRFNQPIDAGECSKRISISLRKSDGSISYPNYSSRNANTSDTIEHPESVIIINCKNSFGTGSRINVNIRDDLRGKEGLLQMIAPYTLGFMTYGELKYLGLENKPNEIYPTSGITLMFSNGVTPSELMKYLSFSPALKSQQEYYDNNYPSEHIHIPLPIEADSTYTGYLKAGLRDQYGNILKDDQKFSFYVQQYLPFVRTRTGIGVIEGYESHKFPISTMNMDSVRVQMGAVDPERIVPLMRTLSWDYYERVALEDGILLSPNSQSADSKSFSKAKIIPTNAKNNVVKVTPLDFDDVLGKDGRGIMFVQIDDMHKEQIAYLKTLVQVTNFGITAKFSPISNLIWVTNLQDASPVPNATVEIRNDSNKVVWTGITDDKGLAKTPGWGKLITLPHPSLEWGGSQDDEEEYNEYYGRSNVRQWVIVKKGNEIAFTSSDWDEGIEPYRFDLQYEWNPKPEKLSGVLFTDRGLYKANEKVEIKGIVRILREGNWKLISSVKTRLIIKNSRNEEIFNQRQKLSPFGSFAAEVPLIASSPMGYYQMMLDYETIIKGKKQWKTIEHGSFRVEAFRPAEFEVIAKFNHDKYIIGDTVHGILNAKYLFGAPMKNEAVKWRLTASRTIFTPPGYKGYYFEPLSWLSQYQQNFQSRELQNQESELDEFGTITMSSVLHVGELQGAISLMLEGDVTSASRQKISGRTSVTVHGGECYIGVKPSATFVKCDSAMTLSIVAVSPEGVLKKNQTIFMKIFKRIWNSVRKAETGGRYAWYSTPYNSLIDSCTIVTTDEKNIKKFVPKEPGFYFVEISGNDVRGNELNAQAYFYASGPGYVPWERTNSDRIDLIANKTNLRPGDIVSLIVKNPYEKAIALVTVEREGIIKHFTTILVGSAPQIDLPITSDFLPNIFVSVVLLQGRTSRPTARVEGDVGRPSFKVGYLALSVSPKEKNLNVSVESLKKEYRPGDTVEVKIAVKDMLGKPKIAEVTLSVADLGVLNLIAYRLPDPFEKFYRERALAVKTTETRMHIIEQRSYDEKGQEVGGGGAAPEQNIPDADGLRKEFRASAYWNPSIITDEQGLASVKFKLPDNLTAFELMAVAQTKNSDFGYVENSFKVNKPLLLQPSLPRFVRVGDTFKSGVVIMNYTDQEQTTQLITSVMGLKWDHRDTTYHTMKAGQAKEVIFNFTAEKLGSAKFVFRAKSQMNSDGLQWVIPVNAPRLRESAALSESLSDQNITEHIIPPMDIFADTGDVEFTAASTAMVGLSGGISYLFHYPYGCLEQRSSAILPMILAKDLVDAFNFEVLKDEDYHAVVTKTLGEIPLYQHSNGGFSYWRDDDYICAYVSAYGMYTLTQARKNGYTIDNNAYSKGLEFLKRVLNGEEKDRYYYSYERDYCTRALILYTLALAGKPEHGYMENLFKDRQALPLFAKAYLLRALHTANGSKSMQDELVRDLSNCVKVSALTAHYEEQNSNDLWWCWDSNTRTTALIMQAMAETQPENPIIPKVVRWLIQEQRLGRWRTTQENIYVVDALATYLRVYEKDEPNFRATISLEGRTIMNEFFKGRTFKVAKTTIPINQLTGGKEYPIDYSKDGNGRLYYGIRMNYFPKSATPQKFEGFSVVKTIEPLSGPSDSILTTGSMMKVSITVSSSQDRHFVVVEDPVPAGFEIVNTAFATTAANIQDEEGEKERGDWWYENAFHHVEKYDDRVILFADDFRAGSHTYTYLVQVARSGSYQMPSTRAEGMYEPEVFGQTASKIVVVQ
jgi:hypothetical protein